MAYIGKQPVIGNFQKCDAIAVVNGQAAYTMQNGGVNFTNYDNVNQFLVSLNGILQSPTDSFTVSGSTLTFASNLSTGDVIDFVMVLGNTLDIGTPSDNTVTTAKLADSSVTTAKLNDASVSLAKLTATGTKDATTFLRGDNTFASPGGGDFVLLSTINVTSAVSEVDITSGIDSTYSNYKIIFNKVRPTVDGAVAYMRVFSAGTINTGAVYRQSGVGMDSVGNARNLFASTSLYSLSHNVGVGNSSDEHISGEIILFDPSESGTYTKLITSKSIFIKTDAQGATVTGGTMVQGLSAITGIRLYFSSGNISTGTIKLYGIN